MGAILRIVTRVQVVMGLLALALLLTPPRAERYGDTLQVVLPILAWACAGSAGAGGEFLLRYAAMFTLAHGGKRLLGEAEINRRPTGGGEGFPSAHASTAVLGASGLVHTCLRGQPIAQGVVLLAAGFVGGSRIDAGKHDIWQVLGGALLGWGCERTLRRPSPQRARVLWAFRATGWAIGRILRATVSRLGPTVRQMHEAIIGRPGAR